MIYTANNTQQTTPNHDIDIATHDRLGVVRIGNTLDIDVNGILEIKKNSDIPVADDTTIGGFKTGQNVHVNSEGIAWVPPATTTKLGAIKSGGDIEVHTDGTVTVNPIIADENGKIGMISVTPSHGLSINPSGDLRVIPATDATIGGVVVDNDTLIIDNNGLIKVRTIKVPVATDTILGGIKSGGDINVNSQGRVSIKYSPATMEGNLGAIKLVSSAQGLNLSNTGNLRVIPATYNTIGGVIVDNNTLEISDIGILKVKNTIPDIPVATENKVGGVRSGGDITINTEGHVKVNYEPATMEGKLGAIKLLSTNQGLNLSNTGNLKVIPATYNSIGGIIPDSNTLEIDDTGILKVKNAIQEIPVATDTKVGGIKSGGDIEVANDGKVTVVSSKVSKATYNAATGALKLNIEVES